jgi:hypothetical protein
MASFANCDHNLINILFIIVYKNVKDILNVFLLFWFFKEEFNNNNNNNKT